MVPVDIRCRIWRRAWIAESEVISHLLWIVQCFIMLHMSDWEPPLDRPGQGAVRHSHQYCRHDQAKSSRLTHRSGYNKGCRGKGNKDSKVHIGRGSWVILLECLIWPCNLGARRTQFRNLSVAPQDHVSLLDRRPHGSNGHFLSNLTTCLECGVVLCMVKCFIMVRMSVKGSVNQKNDQFTTFLSDIPQKQWGGKSARRYRQQDGT